ncbi:hypothetical protein [Mesorhizobium australicum]|uniref:Uncharacterized protein n=1 Tax=Mesorhizobium australicum TaxID=536018 RepID=A0A1X7PPA3_9HYPH|nr:hypothetical protein [Mesorhizobium australicum]SMH53500.1 hypothetical protein SAMN02982922_4853 [Mesorhizobium australicum]
MGWTARGRKKWDIIDGIAMMLLSLAHLAERAAGASHHARCTALWALQRADGIVRDFVADSAWELAGEHWTPAVPEIDYGFEPDDAMALASSLRALALAVLAIAQLRRWMNPPEADSGSHKSRSNPADGGSAQRRGAAFLRVQFCDTS